MIFKAPPQFGRVRCDGPWQLGRVSWSFPVSIHWDTGKKAADISNSWFLPGHLTVVSYEIIHSIK
jgi:hypothetical protein